MQLFSGFYHVPPLQARMSSKMEVLFLYRIMDLMYLLLVLGIQKTARKLVSKGSTTSPETRKFPYTSRPITGTSTEEEEKNKKFVRKQTSMEHGVVDPALKKGLVELSSSEDEGDKKMGPGGTIPKEIVDYNLLQESQVRNLQSLARNLMKPAAPVLDTLDLKAFRAEYRAIGDRLVEGRVELGKEWLRILRDARRGPVLTTLAGPCVLCPLSFPPHRRSPPDKGPQSRF